MSSPQPDRRPNDESPVHDLPTYKVAATQKDSASAINRVLALVAAALSISLIFAFYSRISNKHESDIEISKLQDKLSTIQSQSQKEVRYHLEQADRYESLSRDKIADHESDRNDLKKLTVALSKHGVYPDDGPRVANSILGRIKRLSGFFGELKLQVTDSDLRVTRPLQAIAMIETIPRVLCAKNNLGHAECDLLITNSLSHQFGDEEASYLMKIDIVALINSPLQDDVPNWLKRSKGE